jgi:hypothetical protein
LTNKTNQSNFTSKKLNNEIKSIPVNVHELSLFGLNGPPGALRCRFPAWTQKRDGVDLLRFYDEVFYLTSSCWLLVTGLVLGRRLAQWNAAFSDPL